MRFERVDILRYGALTDRSLTFRPDAKLHVVYGANEAGKSSALRAISDLLFGFPHEVQDAFLHEASTLRIAAAINGKGSNNLSFRRRRGRKNTIVSHEESEVAFSDDVLLPFLGNVSRQVFERAFGLNSGRLRQGGKEMLANGGEIGSLLFSAASGLTGLSALRKNLEAEAEGIFAPRKSKERLFYQILDRYEHARQTEREHELRSGDWKKLVDAIASTKAEIDRLAVQRLETKHELERLKLLRTLAPLIREIDVERAEIAKFIDLNGAAPSLHKDLTNALDSERKTRDALGTTRDEVARLRGEFGATKVDEPVLKASVRIIGLFADKGSHQRAKSDLSRVRGEVENFDLRLQNHARRIGIFVAGGDLAKHQPPDHALALLATLAAEGRDLERAFSDVVGRVGQEREYLNDIERLSVSGQSIDPRPMLDRLSALQADLIEIERADGIRVKIARGTSDIQLAAGRLSPAVNNLDALLCVPLPDVPALVEHRRLITAANDAMLSAEGRLVSVEEDKATLERDIARLEVVGSVVSRERLAESRTERDRLWQAFKADEEGSDANNVESAIAETDRLADIALSDADRVARHAQLKMRLADAEIALSKALRDEDHARQHLDAALHDFRQSFDAAQVAPSDPDTMVEWRRGIDALAIRRIELHALEDEIAELELAERRALPVLLEIASEIGVSAKPQLPAVALARLLSGNLSALSTRWDEGRSLQEKRASSLNTIQKLAAREAEIGQEIETWKARFAEAAALVGLPEGTTVEMAEAAIDVWRQVPDILLERENRQRRVNGMQRDIEQFAGEVGRLVGETAPDLVTLSAEAAIDILQNRAVAAQSDHKRRGELSSSVDQASLRLRRLEEELSVAEERISSLLSNFSADTDATQLIERLEQRDSAEARLGLCGRRLSEQARGLDETSVRVALEAFDASKADLEIESLEALETAHIERFAELTACQSENERQRRVLETGESAEHAVFQRLVAENEAKDLARTWVVLKLASKMLTGSMETYRDKQTDPVIMRAGALFEVLTRGAFTRLLQEYGSDDALQLMAQRANGERVALDGLSEGTGDQLYLSLRLAFLEDYCGRNEPMPLIADDIFQTFDDDRTAAGIRALADSASRFQTILFTHERSVAEIARAELHESVDIIEM
ncbi:hypothetical protein ATY81_02380 [Rhizobium sp. R72]|uniref:YhaN family protein n=1 Tax=unclassified Rhizobium TaxID=2613769 RepID=UPI000B52E262|nr:MULTISPECIES: YhaN family protein [unclassified Rhizobium]OWW04841.1 hypothetical protein ATY81_02380 [Rhizobium sp. R72]OWW05898.1 hypothetical protein ATY80_02380 [Rhizobium sp. R711]